MATDELIQASLATRSAILFLSHGKPLRSLTKGLNDMLYNFEKIPLPVAAEEWVAAKSRSQKSA